MVVLDHGSDVTTGTSLYMANVNLKVKMFILLFIIVL